MANVVVRNDVKGLSDLLERAKGQLAMALPRHLTADRMVRLALTAYQRTPELWDCDLRSIVSSVFAASQLGLELDGVLGHAYLVPYKNRKAGRKECQLIVGYKGYYALARRSGEVARFAPHIVYDGEDFDYQLGSSARLVHRPKLKGRGEPVAVYAEIALKDGSYDFEVFGWEEVLLWQARFARKGRDNQPYGPWVDHLPAMAEKTAVRRLAKRVPVSVEFQRAAALDELAEEQLPQNLLAPPGLEGSRADEVLDALTREPDGDAIDHEAREEAAAE